MKNKAITDDKNKNKNVVNAYFGLTLKLWKALEKRVQDTQTTRSHIVRQAIDAYLIVLNKTGFSKHKKYQKSVVGEGLKTMAVTIRKDQDRWLRLVSEQTGKKISLIGREAIEHHLK